MNKFNQSSIEKLKGVHPDLVKVTTRALQISPIGFDVIEGYRSKENQVRKFNIGLTKSLQSKHLTGYAVDLLNKHHDWNDNESFKMIKDAMMKASQELKIKIRYGGEWNGDDFQYTGPHFELINKKE